MENKTEPQKINTHTKSLSVNYGEISEKRRDEKHGCYFDAQRYGWVRFGKFFPFEVFGDGPFFH